MLNRATLLGHLGKTPELRTVGGQPFCALRVATSRSWTDRATHQRREETEWHHVEVWGKEAEQCAQYLVAGRLVFVEGRIRTDRWTDRATNQERFRTKIIAAHVQFLSGTKRDAPSDRTRIEGRATPKAPGVPEAADAGGAGSDVADAPEPMPPEGEDAPADLPRI